MIDIADLEFRRAGGFRLSVPALTIADGEKVAVVGPSGTGKTTLLNLMAGLLLPDAGHVTVGGVAVSALSASQRRAFRARYIGQVFQDFELVDYLSAAENILYPCRISPFLPVTSDLHQRAKTLARDMGVEDRLARKPSALSQGEQQRIAICRALLAEPPLILADEPTGNLDPDNKDRILDILFAQAAASGATLVTVTHDHDLLPRFDRVVDFADYVRVAA